MRAVLTVVLVSCSARSWVRDGYVSWATADMYVVRPCMLGDTLVHLLQCVWPAVLTWLIPARSCQRASVLAWTLIVSVLWLVVKCGVLATLWQHTSAHEFAGLMRDDDASAFLGSSVPSRPKTPRR